LAKVLKCLFHVYFWLLTATASKSIKCTQEKYILSICTIEPKWFILTKWLVKHYSAFELSFRADLFLFFYKCDNWRIRGSILAQGGLGCRGDYKEKREHTSEANEIRVARVDLGRTRRGATRRAATPRRSLAMLRQFSAMLPSPTIPLAICPSRWSASYGSAGTSGNESLIEAMIDHSFSHHLFLQCILCIQDSFSVSWKERLHRDWRC